jgi:adenosylcobinamide kinase/adenosylcobinamide-phosphate guanylyltransferase
MARIVLVTGGSRSGKSAYAQRLAESLPSPRLYLATCPVVDEEMGRRIERHRIRRRPADWSATIEETLDVAGVLRRSDGQAKVALLDCLTLWVSNLMYQAEQAGRAFEEDDVAEQARALLAACRARPGHVVLVTNEVGMGPVPEHPVTRRFRDLAGRCNQEIAAGADVVTLVVCGLPLHLKGDPSLDLT